VWANKGSMTLRYLRSRCLQSRHPALRPQHGPNLRKEV